MPARERRGTCSRTTLANRLFRWNLGVRWCWNGESVTSAEWQTWHSIGNYFWNIWRWTGRGDVVVGPTEACANGGCRYAYRRAYGTFGTTVLWFEREVTPYVAITVRSEGPTTQGRATNPGKV